MYKSKVNLALIGLRLGLVSAAESVVLLHTAGLISTTALFMHVFTNNMPAKINFKQSSKIAK